MSDVSAFLEKDHVIVSYNLITITETHFECFIVSIGLYSNIK